MVQGKRSKLIPDRSRPGLTTAAFGAASQQGAKGKYATVGGGGTGESGRSTEKVRIGTWNIGTMTGRGREIVDVMERRRVKALCVQETKWKGNCSRQLSRRYKLIYTRESTKINGVGIIVCKDLADKVVQVKRKSDRLIKVQVIIRDRIWNIISAYAPQVNRPQEEKDAFLEELEDMVQAVPNNEIDLH